MNETLNNVVGIEDLVNVLQAKGVNISDVDFNIASIIFDKTKKNVKRKSEDYDGLTVEKVTGFIYDNQIDALIHSFPNAAKLIQNLSRDKNYGFKTNDGRIRRTGTMGSPDPIMESKQMVEAYIQKKYNTLEGLFENSDSYNQFMDEIRNISRSR